MKTLTKAYLLGQLAACDAVVDSSKGLGCTAYSIEVGTEDETQFNCGYLDYFENEKRIVPCNDLAIAKLWRGLDKCNLALSDLNSAGMMKKAEKAEAVINEVRDLLAGLVSTVHTLKSDIGRLRGV